MINRMTLTFTLFIVLVLLVGAWLTVPAFATYCQISNISYNYPQQTSPNQGVTTSVTVSGVCAPDDAYYYSIRSDLNTMSGMVLSDVSTPIGYSQGQNWTVTVQNQVIAPATPTPWQIQFAVYIFADITSGEIIDSVTFKPIMIQVGTPQAFETSTALTTIQTQAPPVIVSSTIETSASVSTQTVEAAPSADLLRVLGAGLVLVLVLLVVVVVVKRRQNSRNA